MNTRPMFTPAERRALQLSGETGAEARVREIAGEACKIAGVTMGRLTGTDRSAQMCKIRDAVAFKAHEDGIPGAQIARVLKRDPTSVLAGIRREAARRKGEEA